jgi:hypothetical protein
MRKSPKMNIVMDTNLTQEDRGGNASQDDSDDDDDDDESGSDSDSAGEALTKLLGLPSVDALALSRDEDVSSCQEHCSTIADLCAVRTESVIESLIIQHGLRETYQNTSVCIFPTALSIPAALMRRLADEVVLRSALPPSDPMALPGVQRTYETITKMIDQKKQQPPGTTTNETVVSRHRELTRLENLRVTVGGNYCVTITSGPSFRLCCNDVNPSTRRN